MTVDVESGMAWVCEWWMVAEFHVEASVQMRFCRFLGRGGL